MIQTCSSTDTSTPFLKLDYDVILTDDSTEVNDLITEFCLFTVGSLRIFSLNCENCGYDIAKLH